MFFGLFVFSLDALVEPMERHERGPTATPCADVDDEKFPHVLDLRVEGAELGGGRVAPVAPFVLLHVQQECVGQSELLRRECPGHGGEPKGRGTLAQDVEIRAVDVAPVDPARGGHPWVDLDEDVIVLAGRRRGRKKGSRGGHLVCGWVS